jgi:heat shock protein HslJ
LASVLQFDSDGTVHGGTGFGGGCDDFTADYTVEGRALTIGPLSGHLACTAAGALDIRIRLAAVTAYEVVGDTLVLSSAAGTQLLVYGHV